MGKVLKKERNTARIKRRRSSYGKGGRGTRKGGKPEEQVSQTRSQRGLKLQTGGRVNTDK